MPDPRPRTPRAIDPCERRPGTLTAGPPSALDQHRAEAASGTILYGRRFNYVPAEDASMPGGPLVVGPRSTSPRSGDSCVSRGRCSLSIAVRRAGFGFWQPRADGRADPGLCWTAAWPPTRLAPDDRTSSAGEAPGDRTRGRSGLPSQPHACRLCDTRHPDLHVSAENRGSMSSTGFDPGHPAYLIICRWFESSSPPTTSTRFAPSILHALDYLVKPYREESACAEAIGPRPARVGRRQGAFARSSVSAPGLASQPAYPSRIPRRRARTHSLRRGARDSVDSKRRITACSCTWPASALLLAAEAR
jgi:hypothetical protein